jgi:hypothetical protein
LNVTYREQCRNRVKRWMGLHTAFPRCVAALAYVLFAVMSGAALAQTTGSVDPNPAPVESLPKADVPPGGCMPIGLTAAGEMVFPIQCKEFIERERGKAVEPKPVAADEQKPVAADQEAATKPSEPVAPENSKPPDEVVETNTVSKRDKHEPRKRTMNSYGCQHYRTYDRESGTFRSFDGHRRVCQFAGKAP